jgi:hypothetical protein
MKTSVTGLGFFSWPKSRGGEFRPDDDEVQPVTVTDHNARCLSPLMPSFYGYSFSESAHGRHRLRSLRHAHRALNQLANRETKNYTTHKVGGQCKVRKWLSKAAENT